LFESCKVDKNDMSHSIIAAIVDLVRPKDILTNALSINGEREAHRDGKMADALMLYASAT